MTTPLDLKPRIRAFLLETFPALKSVSLDDATPLLEGGAVDSLGLLEIVTFLESECGARLDDEDVVVENFESIAAIERLAQRKANTATALEN